MLKLSRDGFWILTQGRATRYPWRALLPLLLTPVLMALCLIGAVARSSQLTPFKERSFEEAVELYGGFQRASIENLLALKPAPTKSALPTLELYVPNNTLEQMSRAKRTGDPRLGHAPGGDTPYFGAYFRDESRRLQRAKIAYRGFMPYHHWPEKPSLRIRIKKKQIALGRRYVELTRPKDALAIRHQIPEMLARGLGLVSTINEPVRLFINNKPFGVYLRCYRPGEALALASGRMPGTFFKGDALGERKHLNLWESSAHWKVFGEESAESVAVFDRFLEILKNYNEQDASLKLREVLDEEVYARLAAVNILSGNLHTDGRHNQMYFLCSNQGKLEAVLWDPTCYEVVGRRFAPVDTVLDYLMAAMTANPLWVHRRNQILFQLLEGPGSGAALARHVDACLALRRPDLEADPHLSELLASYRCPRSVREIDAEAREIKDWAVAKEKYLRQYLGAARVHVIPHPDRPGQSRVESFGMVAVKVLDEDGNLAPAYDSLDGTVELLYPGLSERYAGGVYRPGRVVMRVIEPKATPMAYRVAASPERLRFINAITGAAVTPASQGPARRFKARTRPPSLFHEAPGEDRVLGPGTVELREDLRLGEGVKLTIMAGTRLKLAAGVGIYVRGPVAVRGTARQPVIIEGLEDAIWGAFAVSGAASAGSRFRHMKVRGGSIGGQGGQRFKGMFNVYDCPDVQLEDCVFGVNHRGDDAVNLAESRVRVLRCRWDGARADALDLDQCQGLVKDSVFENAGNDGLDLMGCRLRIEACRFEFCGDKGISIGEKTEALVLKSRIRGCVRGVELKDASRAILQACVLVANRVAVHAYQKKWLYGAGGSGLLIDCGLRASQDADVMLRKRSELLLKGTAVGKIRDGKSRARRVEAVPEEWERLRASLAGEFFNTEVTEDHGGGRQGR